MEIRFLEFSSIALPTKLYKPSLAERLFHHNIVGMPEIIVNKIGFLATLLEPISVSRGIYWVLKDEQLYSRLSIRAREKVVQEYELKSVANRIKIYIRTF